MVSMELVCEGLRMRFLVREVAAAKASRNPSESSASDCCGKALKQVKFCSECNAQVAGKTQRKLKRIGKQEYLYPASITADIKAAMGENSVTIGGFMQKDSLPGLAHRIDGVSYLADEEKHEQKFAHFSALLDGRAAIGTAVLRDNEYEVVITKAADGTVELWKLNDISQVNDKPEVRGSVCNKAVLDIEQQVVDKKLMLHEHEFNHRDKRLELFEQALEKFLLSGEMPQVKQQVEQEANDERLAELAALLE